MAPHVKKRKACPSAVPRRKKPKEETTAEINKRVAARILARGPRVPLLHQPAVCIGKRKRAEHNYHAMLNSKHKN
jgi:hypothetical protein